MEGTVFKLIFAQTYPFRPGIAANIEDAVKAAVGSFSSHWSSARAIRERDQKVLPPIGIHRSICI
jgi:hypothetical protein